MHSHTPATHSHLASFHATTPASRPTTCSQLPCNAVVVLWISGMGMEDGHTIITRVVHGDSCAWGAKLECEISPFLYAGTIVTFVAVSIYFGLFAFFLMRSWRQLSGQLYQKYRMVNMSMRLQVRPPHLQHPSPPLVLPPTASWRVLCIIPGATLESKQPPAPREAHSSPCTKRHCIPFRVHCILDTCGALAPAPRVQCPCTESVAPLHRECMPAVPACIVLAVSSPVPHDVPSRLCHLPHPSRRRNTMHLPLQFRFNGSMVLALIIGISLTWYMGTDACVNYAVTWYGNAPVTFVIVCFQVCPPPPPPRLLRSHSAHPLSSHTGIATGPSRSACPLNEPEHRQSGRMHSPERHQARAGAC